MCTDSQNVFSIPMRDDPNKAVTFMGSLTNLCGVNYTIVSEEIQNLLGVDMSLFVSTSLLL